MDNPAQDISNIMIDPARASILWKLRTNRAYTAIELAKEANISPAEMSQQLSLLIKAGLLKEIERRKRGYYRLSNDKVVQALQGYYKQSGITEKELEEDYSPKGMRYCRTCYNHLAGKAGVVITSKLRERNFISIGDDSHFVVTKAGEAFFKTLKISLEPIRKERRIFAKACIDFSERKYHLGGALGVALLNKMLQSNWIQKIENSREIRITAKGKQALYNRLQVDL